MMLGWNGIGQKEREATIDRPWNKVKFANSHPLNAVQRAKRQEKLNTINPVHSRRSCRKPVVQLTML